MRTRFLRVLGAVAVSAAVVGSVFASVWLLSGSPDRSLALHAAAETSSSVVHATLPAAAPAVKHAVVRTVHVRTSASRGFTARATAHPLNVQARPAARVIPQQVAAPTVHAPVTAPTTSAPQPKPKPTPAKPTKPTAPKPTPTDPAKPSTSVSSASLAKVSSTSKTDSKTTAADKRKPVAAPVRPASVDKNADPPKDADPPKSDHKDTGASHETHG